MATIAVLPHADLPHLLPFFRLARELQKLGHRVRLLGSDVVAIGRRHSEAWADLLHGFGLGDELLLHLDPGVAFQAWLRHTAEKQRFDLLIVDAVWQAVSYELEDLRGLTIVVHHAGLPDFRTGDMPPWYFVHPAHPAEAHNAARRYNEEIERAGRGVRGLLRSISPGTSSYAAQFAFGCGEFENLPAIRAMSLCPAVEFPAERGRIVCLGTLLAGPEDKDWRSLPPATMRPSQPLIACVFGTTGLQTHEEYRWLLDCGARLAAKFTDCQVITVIPGPVQAALKLPRLASNLLVFPWIPLWELLNARTGAKVVVTTPGVGAFRDAVASGTPTVCIPRRLDQFGAAARVEYFGLGFALVSSELPPSDVLVPLVARALSDEALRLRVTRMANEVRTFDATQPLKQFLARIGR